MSGPILTFCHGQKGGSLKGLKGEEEEMMESFEGLKELICAVGDSVEIPIFALKLLGACLKDESCVAQSVAVSNWIEFGCLENGH